MDLVKSAWFTKILRLVCDCDEINMIVMVVIKLFQDWLMDYDIINKGNMFSLLPLTILYLYVKCNLM